jgi:membrane protein implicated in regulation of membrane protease activity
MLCGTYGGMTAMMIGGWVFYLALFILVVLAIAWLVRALRRPSTPTRRTDNTDR